MAIEVARSIPMSSRSSFLRGVAMASASSTATGLALDFAEAMNCPAAVCSLDWFAPHVGSRFVIETTHDPLTLELVAADPLPRHERMVAEKFSLIFRGPRTLQLAQKSCRLTHVVLGSLELFLVPVASRSPEHFTYEAVFNSEKGV